VQIQYFEVCTIRVFLPLALKKVHVDASLEAVNKCLIKTVRLHTMSRYLDRLKNKSIVCLKCSFLDLGHDTFLQQSVNSQKTQAEGLHS
jgi:hypothetical protein